MRGKNNVKKLVSFSEDTTKMREAIVQLSSQTGLTESRIIEDCMICGFGFLYGKEEDIPEIVSLMRKRYGNIPDTENLNDFLRGSLPEKK